MIIHGNQIPRNDTTAGEIKNLTEFLLKRLTKPWIINNKYFHNENQFHFLELNLMRNSEKVLFSIFIYFFFFVVHYTRLLADRQIRKIIKEKNILKLSSTDLVKSKFMITTLYKYIYFTFVFTVGTDFIFWYFQQFHKK